MPRRWKISEPNPAADALASQLRTSPLLAQILLNRGMSAVEDCMKFMRPTLMLLHDPMLMAGMAAASERLAEAVRLKKKIVVFGDYDVDGITATTILWHAIGLLGGNVQYYIPHRIDEGYGLNAEAIEQLCKEGAELIVSVDCGVTAHEPAKMARQHGVDLIITDHHEWQCEPGDDQKPVLPDCYAIVHPRLPGPDGVAYPNGNLCGAGVAFKVAWALGKAISGGEKVSDAYRDFLVEATGLAALGTIADVVPLVGENRILAHFGLSGLKQSKLTGIKALIASANLTGQSLDSYHVGFLLGPRLNACGRMGHAALAVEMLTHADEAKAMEIGTFLEQQNRARQAMEKKILAECIEQVESMGLASDESRAIVLAGEGWHPGVIGIVASRIMERYYRPTVMIAINAETKIGAGSARSIPGFHLAHALEACKEHLISCGGHEMAAGLKIAADKLEDFRVALAGYAREKVTDEMLIPELKIECNASLGQINMGLVQELQRLGPFGQGNRRPVLCCRNLELAAPPRRVGKTGDHLQITVRQGNNQFKAIAFNFGKMFDELHPGMTLDLAVEPTINSFNGYSNVELEVKDMLLA